MSPTTRFVIFSSARSGTSLVTATLSKHPDIYMHAEIYQPKRENHILREFREAHEVDALAADPERFARAVLDFTPGPPVVGFKMWTWQAPAAARALLADESVHKILIERENRLAAFSSAQLAHATGLWNLWPGEAPPEQPLLPFDPVEFAAFRERQQQLFDDYRARAQGPVFDLRYAELPEPGITRIQQFLGVAPRALDPRRVKLHGDDILARFEAGSRPAILAELDRIGRPDWAAEERGSGAR